jgi:RHS repeat-associated protein
MPKAARKDDQIEHSSALGGVLVGLAAGALVAAVIGAEVVSGGMATFAFAAMVAGGASLGGTIGEALGGFLHSDAGPITTGASKVFIGRKPAARAVVDRLTCHPDVIAQGSRTVMIENFPASRVDDQTACDGKIGQGCASVEIGKEPGTYVNIGREVPLWLEIGVQVLGLVGMVGELTLAEDAVTVLREGDEALEACRTGECTTLGHPVDVATGNVVDGATDVALPGLIEIRWERRYCSAQAGEDTALGRGGWTHSYDQWITDHGERWTLRVEDGRDVYFARAAAGESAFNRRERLVLTREDADSFSVYSLKTRLTRFFAPLAPGGRARLRQVSDAHGNSVTLYYGPGGALERIVDTAGREIHVHTGTLDRVTRLEVWSRGVVEQTVDYFYHPGGGELESTVNALGHADRYTYDDRHRMTRTTLKNGVSFHYAYALESGRCIRTWGDGGLHTVELSYDVGRRVTQVTGTEQPRVYHWNRIGSVVREETPDGRCIRTLALDREGYVLAEGVTDTELTRYAYDDRGNRTQVVDAAGNVTAWEYRNDRPAQRTGPDGLVTTYEHDDRGALTTVTYPSGVRYSLSYDPHGRLSAVRDGDRLVTSFAHDGEHNVVREIDARGAATEYGYDPLGRPIERKDALGRVTRVEYDALGQPIAIHAPDGTVRRAEYEPLGNVARATDALGQITEMAYAGTGVLTQLVPPDGQAWSLGYDRDERLTEIQNPHGERYAFAYDSTGRVASERTFDGRELSYAYAATGRLSSIEYPDRTFRVFHHDPLGNLVGDDGLDSHVSFERDNLGRLTRATLEERNGKVVTEIERDALGRVVVEKQNGQATRFAYDERGRRVERMLPDGSTTRYGYDDAHALAHVEHDGHRFSLDRDTLGRETARRAADGSVEIRSAYDTMDRLVERHVAGGSAHGAISLRTWRYDALGRVREIGDDRWGKTYYQHDSIGQLIEAQRGAYHEVFEYDVTGSLRNILSGLTPGGQGRAWDTEPGNLLTRTDTNRYEYDARGRRVKKVALVDADHSGVRAGDVTEYVWDERDRLREVKKPAGERVLFTYDAFGRRVRKDVLPGEEHGTPRGVEFLWDGNELAAERDSRRGARVFVHEPGTFVPMIQAEQGEVFAVVNDHLGMPKELVDQDGRVAWSAAHSAWGKVAEDYRDPSARRKVPVESPFRLLGQYADEETGLCYTRHRYFDAEVGRWCSPDPLGIRGGRDLHGFNGSPVGAVDPYGLSCLDEDQVIYRAMKPVDGAFVESPLEGAPNANQMGARTPQSNPEFYDMDVAGPEATVGPSATEQAGLSASTQPRDLFPSQVNGSVRVGDLPEGLGAVNDGGKHVSIYSTSDTTFAQYQGLLNSIPWKMP